MDILRILDDLHHLAVDRPKSYFGLTVGLNKDEVSMQIAKVRASLPNEVKAAAVTVRESERIVDSAREDASITLEGARKEAERLTAEAQREANRILEQARIQQERMIAESEILRISKAQAEEIRSTADRDAGQMRRGAEKYAFDVLCQLEGVVGKVMSVVDRGKAEMVRPEPLPAQPQRERVRA
ncbi:MAG: hypothetical protein HY248_00095 [Fimbriimonas ginsengisoli]|uniref:ATPase n=1 Tax=Fimbriimonas ginsengisoli TaxID=1005039 RepID=A0A931PX36_FIMGI|nr:hypothetical protein [Fimbriimonas ginsengisoli]MBI3720924.1 hypothetical protein [Fimbriimonas ginsengisoli]